MEDMEALKKRLDHLSNEISEIRKLIQGMESGRQESDRAWEDLMRASEEISELWTDGSVVEEIREQREKSW